MCPCSKSSYLIDGTRTHPIFSRETSPLDAHRTTPANVQNLFFGKFGVSSRLASGMGLPALSDLIHHVVLTCAEEEMVWVHTETVVATVKYAQLSIDTAVV